jgi:rSAM/selenodomain-associated transferase 2
VKLSVIIPAWCEERMIAGAVRAAAAIGDEVIVVDAGSPDRTAALAGAAGARVVRASKGRGVQLHAGALASCGDTLLFLHADATLPPRARLAIEQSLAGDRAIAGGNFRLRFAAKTRAARVYGWANHQRRKWLDVYYGDSALFLRRSVYEQLGGFRPLPILEDYELIGRLERRFRTAYLEHIDVEVSARRFESAPWGTLLIWGAIQSLYCLGVPAERLAALYHDRRAARDAGEQASAP